MKTMPYLVHNQGQQYLAKTMKVRTLQFIHYSYMNCSPATKRAYYIN